MTPAARHAAAIGILDAIGAGAPAERTLTTWARKNRFAGSGDRAAIRDLVFDALRRRRSYGWLGGGESGRALMLGALRAAGTDPATIFDGTRYAPAPLQPGEAPERVLCEAPEAVRLDCPDWLVPALSAALGAEFGPVMRALRDRAPVFLRVNTRQGPRDAAQAALAEEGIETTPHPLASTALQVVSGRRKVRGSRAVASGRIELQDAASQAVVETLLPLAPGARVLDYCAGGGGKSLALAAGSDAAITAHDADAGRMADLPARAARADAAIEILAGPPTGPAFDLVLCDVPCSGSGAWRRAPEGKWRLTAERLATLCAVQREILDRAADLTAADGRLAYATCSLLTEENQAQIEAFLARRPDWRCLATRRFTPLDGGDGFFVAQLTRV